MAFTLCSSGAIVRKAGKNVSSDVSASGAFISEASNQAEAHIFRKTRKDWVTNYASVDSNAQATLAEVSSSLAAMDLIRYNMDLYPRKTALGMIDMLYDKAQDGIRDLKEQQIKDAISS